MASTLTQDSELALQLQNIVQPKLVEAGWSAGDSTLAEYIVLMLVNGKDKDQVASELANDLLGLGPEDENTKEFAQWLFDQVAILTGQGPAAPAPIPSAGDDLATQPIPTGALSDADMSGGMDLEQNQNIPTGPKSMRSTTNTRGAGRRQMNHASRAMDRSNDSMLHKVRNNSSERIGRNTPRGPRGGMHGNQFKGMQGGRGTQASMSSQQQNQLMDFMNQQMEMMQRMLTGQGGQNVPGMPGAAGGNQNFRGRSLADRVNSGPRGGGRFNDRQNPSNPNQAQNGNNAQPGDTDMGGDSNMETDAAKSNPETTMCRFNLKCTKPDCQFAHQSPLAPPNTVVDMTLEPCSFGPACQNRKCTARHPSPAKRTQYKAEQDCKYWPHCQNRDCPFKHPDMPMCKFGGDCTTDGCKFTHWRTICKFNPCMNPKCPFKHEPGQKKGSKWVKGDGDTKMDGDHVSERKFVSEDGAQSEELIKPDAQASLQTADIVT